MTTSAAWLPPGPVGPRSLTITASTRSPATSPQDAFQTLGKAFPADTTCVWLIIILGALTAVGIWFGYTKSMRKQQAEIDRGKESGWFDEGSGGGGPEELRQLSNDYRHLREGRKKAVWVTLGVTAALVAALAFLLSLQQNAREDAYVEGWNKGWSEMCKYLFTSYVLSEDYQFYGPPQGSYDYCLASAPYEDILKSRASADAPTWGDAAEARSWGERDAAEEVWEQFVTGR